MYSKEILRAVDQWATGYEMLTEFGGCDLPGRFDALLVPTSAMCSQADRKGNWWSRFGLVVVEVKTNREDFLRGLREGQLERYRDFEAITGVYLAVPKGFRPQPVASLDELPEGVGMLTTRYDSQGRMRCVCRKRPVWKTTVMSQELMWRVLFALGDKAALERRARDKHDFEVKEQMHARLSHLLWMPLKRIEQEARLACGEAT